MDKSPTTEDWQDTGEQTKRDRRLPEKVSLLRQKLSQKAKQEPKFRFYVLYDRIYRMDVLEAAWERVRRNNGSPGVDGITIDQIVNSDQGAAGFLEGIQDTLRNKTYQAKAVLRVYIKKDEWEAEAVGNTDGQRELHSIAIRIWDGRRSAIRSIRFAASASKF